MSDVQPTLLLSPEDNVLIAVVDLAEGNCVIDGDQRIVVRQSVPFGHKLARQSLSQNAKVIKYGAEIGSAKCDIASGEWVHLHNLQSDYIPTRSEGEVS
ncbi:UxaA family hydrolase [Erythrobacter sp.]|uniref:UxaA family hydrolase n=1 Tax=Erythrobacter sp. TaxID=1042 RepID=UPI001AFFFA3A|nr:UxaA family hydrolase [Erythrobacter sp.]MBO6525432.1 UxaA family hydrolase [Erythrobacter sp.]MBO6529895.1 UxaA family hydrolase [Erythrobacter sp.]